LLEPDCDWMFFIAAGDNTGTHRGSLLDSCGFASRQMKAHKASHMSHTHVMGSKYVLFICRLLDEHMDAEVFE
jgi:hypothetical protein